MCHSLDHDRTSQTKAREFKATVRRLHDHRYFVEEEVVEHIKKAPKRRSKAVGQFWSLDTSIWAPRALYADSESLHDTDAHMLAVLRCDWAYSMMGHGTRSFIGVKDPSPTSLEDCFQTLSDHANDIYSIFDYYATLGSGEPLSIQLNSFKKFIEECKLVEKSSIICGAAAFDRLFVAVNAGSDNSRNIDRQEFMQIVIRMAWMKYEGKGRRYCDAIRALLEEAIMPRVDRRALHNASQYRETVCYTQEVSEALQSSKQSLYNIFKVYANANSQVGSSQPYSNANKREFKP